MPARAPATFAAPLAALAGGYLLAAALLHLALPAPLHLYAAVRSEKLAMMNLWRGHYFSAAFGSSHVHDGFDPAGFDSGLAAESAAAASASVRSVNLGVEAGSQAEQRAMALEWLRRMPAPAGAEPCLVLLELNAGANTTRAFLVNPRAINLYGLESVRFVTQLTARGMPWQRRAGRVTYAAAAAAMHYASVGMLSNRIFAPPLDRVEMAHELANDRRGEHELPNAPAGQVAVARTLAGLPALPVLRYGMLTPGNSSLVADLADAAPERRLAFVYIVMPLATDRGATTLYPDHLDVPLRDGGTAAVPILNLSQPLRYPELFAPELWHDIYHLNGEGAQMASAVLGRELAAWYRSHGAPPACGRG